MSEVSRSNKAKAKAIFTWGEVIIPHKTKDGLVLVLQFAGNDGLQKFYRADRFKPLYQRRMDANDDLPFSLGAYRWTEFEFPSYVFDKSGEMKNYLDSLHNHWPYYWLMILDINS